jgi:phospholipase/lecithinase/hemolysin
LFQYGIGDIYDFSGLTSDIVLDNELSAKASEYSAHFKAEFKSAMDKYTETRPDLRLLFFDGLSNFNAILADPLAYGFANTTGSAVDDLADTSFTGPGADYLHWDCCHGTTKLNKLMPSSPT